MSIRSHITTWLRRLFVLALGTTMSWIAISAYLAVKDVPPDNAIAAYAAFRVSSPWDFGRSPFSTSDASDLASIPDPEAEDALLRAQLRRYPLAPEIWLARARLAIRMRQPAERVLKLLKIAIAIKPWDADTNWQAAMLSLQVNEMEAAERHLERYLVARPNDVGKVALLARRWLTSDEVIYRIIPPDGDSLGRLLSNASRWGDADLAAAAWRGLADRGKANAHVVTPYVEYLLRAGDSSRAVDVWRYVEAGYTPQAIANGSFTEPLRDDDPLGWRTRAPEGTDIIRDTEKYFSAPASLAITFDGKHNVDLASPVQIVPIESGRRYRLAGYWRAEGLTTRSLPLLVVTDYPPRHALGKVTAAAPHGWPWQQFQLDLEIPEDVTVIALSARRYTTDAFDRFIAGTLHLDDLTLTPVPTAPAVATHTADAK